MKKYLSVLFLIVFIVPSVAFASWWNPFSWKVFSFLHKKEVPRVQVEVQKTPEEKINDLQKQLDDLKNQQPVSAPATTPAVKEVKKTAPVVTVKPISKNQDQTAQYKKILLDKIAEIYATANKISNYADIIIDTINERIDFSNSKISINETIINSITDSYTIGVVTAFNASLRANNKVSEDYINMQNIIKDNGKKMMGGANEEATMISQKTSISLTEFEKFNTSYNTSQKVINEESLKQEKEVSDYKDSVEKTNNVYKQAFALLKIKIDSLQEQIDNSLQPTQYNYIPPAPVITIPRIQTCSFSSSSQWGQTTGQMTCY